MPENILGFWAWKREDAVEGVTQYKQILTEINWTEAVLVKYIYLALNKRASV